jgi:hypothetical protein
MRITTGARDEDRSRVRTFIEHGCAGDEGHRGLELVVSYPRVIGVRRAR